MILTHHGEWVVANKFRPAKSGEFNKLEGQFGFGAYAEFIYRSCILTYDFLQAILMDDFERSRLIFDRCIGPLALMFAAVAIILLLIWIFGDGLVARVVGIPLFAIAWIHNLRVMWLTIKEMRQSRK